MSDEIFLTVFMNMALLFCIGVFNLYNSRIFRYFRNFKDSFEKLDSANVAATGVLVSEYCNSNTIEDLFGFQATIGNVIYVLIFINLIGITSNIIQHLTIAKVKGIDICWVTMANQTISAVLGVFTI